MQSSTLVCQNSAIFNSINSAILNPTNSAILNSFNSAILNSISSAILRHYFYKSSKILPEKILNAYIQFMLIAYTVYLCIYGCPIHQPGQTIRWNIHINLFHMNFNYVHIGLQQIWLWEVYFWGATLRDKKSL